MAKGRPAKDTNWRQYFDNPSDRFINRELSWLEFNYRVLQEAYNKHNPILERVKFLSISSSNLDEFFMVRVAGLKDLQVHHGERLSIDGLTPSQQLERIKVKADALIQDQQQCWVKLRQELKRHDIHILNPRSLKANQKKWLKNHFMTNIFPALSPIAIDPAHPMPFLPNLGFAAMFKLARSDDKKNQLAVVLFPSKLSRFIAVDNDHRKLILLEDVVQMFSDLLFPNAKVKGFGLVHITRDSELAIGDEAEDLVSYFETAVQRRKRGSVIHLKVSKGLPKDIRQFLVEEYELASDDICVMSQLLGLDKIMALYDQPYPDLKFQAYDERFPERINDFGGDCFAAIAEKDIVVHHPYESFDVVVKFLQQAAQDPKVVAIKQTLYRTSSDSDIVKALIEAAEAGKSVTVVVELKARFDEEANIRWAKNLERVGAQVVFGFVELKTHAKVSLVVREENQLLKSYIHFGTGNYHPETARVYSDLSFFTCDEALCNNATLLFNFLTGYSSPEKLSHLAVSPINLKAQILHYIEREIQYAEQGKTAGIWAKMNALVDAEIIDALYRASQVGVKIHLVIRGISCLRPGIKGVSENIKVTSIVGRFLEHARIYCFSGGHPLPSSKNHVFMSSADWMPRNLHRRVEVMVPITNPTVHEQILEQIMLANINDVKQSWSMNSDGTYKRKRFTRKSFSAHEYFMTNPSLSGRGKALTVADSQEQRQKIYQLFSFVKKNDPQQ